MTIKELVEKAHKNAVDHGFWENWVWIKRDKVTGHVEHYNNAIGNMLMLIVSEVAEAQDGLRHNDIDNFKEELADIVLRVADLAGGLDVNLEEEIKKKMRKNAKRPYKHGKVF